MGKLETLECYGIFQSQFECSGLRKAYVSFQALLKLLLFVECGYNKKAVDYSYKQILV